MIKGKNSLGRGLDALINSSERSQIENNVMDNYYGNNNNGNNHDHDNGDNHNAVKAVDAEAGSINKIDINSIAPNPFQPRTVFEPQALEELRKSILENGLIQPITVRKIDINSYQLISGERRLKACKELGYKTIPAYILIVETDEAMLAMALIENLQREKLNAIEVAMAYKRLMEECSLTQEKIAEKVGKDRTTVANSMRLLKLPGEIQNSLIKEEISMGHARALINLPDSNMQLEALSKILIHNLSVRKVEQLVKKMLVDSKKEIKNRHIPNIKDTAKDSGLRDVEDKLRRIFATKVSCKQRQDGSGEIAIEFFSLDELERLFDLFDVIEKYNN
ncbi:MAG: ParB/RepB/Spo0J family partition protein [Bacteroidota bacterium]|nr:ParB/RepB/Spo0J family partition protein [Bacteroidota bacterium]